MLHDHTASLERRTARLAASIAPVLRTFSGIGTKADGESDGQSGSRWFESAMRDFQTTEQVHERVQLLFAGAGSASDTRRDPALVAAELLQRLDSLQSAAHRTANQIATELSPLSPNP
jgi:hypothetical protein